MKYFRFSTMLGTFYKQTEKTRANNTDAKAILNEYLSLSGKKAEDFDNEIIENTLNTIKHTMELVEINVNGKFVSYKNKYVGGTDYKYVIIEN